VKTLEEMQAEVVTANARHDWGNGEPVPFQTAIANLHGEVSEAWEAFADIFIRLLDNCAAYGIDLRAEYERKVAYNRTRPVKHGGKRA
jgi:sugar phosphate isomerase/epimerase